MFVFVCFVLFALLAWAYACYSDRVTLIEQQDSEMHQEIRATKEEMLDFLYCPNRTEYYLKIYTWIYHNNTRMFDWLVNNPDYIRDYWLVNPRKMYVDHDNICKYAMNSDAAKILKAWIRDGGSPKDPNGNYYWGSYPCTLNDTWKYWHSYHMSP
jgi:hypothetical protein